MRARGAIARLLSAALALATGCASDLAPPAAARAPSPMSAVVTTAARPPPATLPVAVPSAAAASVPATDDPCAAPRDGRCAGFTVVAEYVGSYLEGPGSRWTNRLRWHELKVLATWSPGLEERVNVGAWVPVPGGDDKPLPALQRGKVYLVSVAMEGMSGCMPMIASIAPVPPPGRAPTAAERETQARIDALGPTCPLPRPSR